MREFTVTASLASKLAAICINLQESLVFGEHYLDRHAMSNLLNDSEVATWIKSLGPLAPTMRRQA